MSTRALLSCFCLFAGLASGACDVSGQVGSTYVSSELIAPATGGTITVEASDTPELDGSSIQIPPRALAQPIEIGVVPHVSLAGGDWIMIGPSVDWEPVDLMLASPAQYTIPAAIPFDRQPEDVVLLVDGPDGLKATAGPQLQCDGSYLRFSAPVLGTFQAAIGKPCRNRAGCSSGNACVHGGCRPGE